jgi:dipeptidyl-peptidase 4
MKEGVEIGSMADDFGLSARRACRPARFATACLLVIALMPVRGLLAQGSKADYERAMRLSKRTEGLVDRDRVKSHWLAGNNTFWYRVQTGPKQQEVLLVDAVRGTRQAGSEAANQASTQATSLSSEPDIPRRSVTTGQETTVVFVNRSAAEIELFWMDFEAQRRSYGKIGPGGQREMQTFAGHVWLVVDLNGKELALVRAADEPGHSEIDGKPLPAVPAKQTVRGLSPDGTWIALIKSNNIWLRSAATNEEFALSTDGTTDDAYEDELHWSPDSTKLAAFQVERAQSHKVYFVESSPEDQLQPKLHTIDYLKPGDRIAHPRVRLFALTGRRQVTVEDGLFPSPWSITRLRWAPDSSRFTFLYNQRGHQLLRIIAVDGCTGAASTLVEETSPTFIDYSRKLFSHWLDETEELIWMSERDGWNHLWLYDARSGEVKNQVTRGPWVVRKVE